MISKLHEYVDDDGGYWTPSPKAELAMALVCIGAALFVASSAIYALVNLLR